MKEKKKDKILKSVHLRAGFSPNDRLLYLFMIGFSDSDSSDGRLADHDGVRRRRGLDPLRAGLQLPLVILDPRRPQDRCHHGEPVWFALLFSWRT